jgi:hypothetical protein
MKFLINTFLISTILFYSACSSVQVAHEKVSKIKTVAVVGFVVNQETPKGIEMNSSAPPGIMNLKAPDFKDIAQSETIYRDLGKSLTKKLGWKTLEKEALEKNAYYQDFYQRTMKGIQNRPPVNEKIDCYTAKAITDSWPIEIMKFEDRKKLLEKLKVQGLIVASYEVKLENKGGLKKLVGAGDYHPKATLRFQLFDATQEKPIWADYSAVGKTLEQGTAHVFGGVTDQTGLLNQSVVAANYATEKLIENFREQKQ